jgi:hypothetical protein
MSGVVVRTLAAALRLLIVSGFRKNNFEVLTNDQKHVEVKYFKKYLFNRFKKTAWQIC